MKRIALIGSFDVENYGDLLFPVVLETQLKKRNYNFKIVLFSPNGGKKPFDSGTKVYPVNLLEKIHRDMNFDSIIIGGGDLIRLDYEVTPEYIKNLISSESLWVEPILIANRYNIPVLFNAPGVPFHFSNFKKENVQKLIDCVDYCSVRDEKSREHLLECDVKNVVHVVPDTITLINETYNKNELIENAKKLIQQGVLPNSRKYIVIQHNRYRSDDHTYLDYIREFIDMVIAEYNYDIYLVPIGYVHNDMEFLEKIHTDNKKVHLIKEKLSPYDMLSVFVCSQGFVGTSLHGLITTSAYNIPILAINEQRFTKVSGYLKLINKQDVDVNDIRQLKDVFNNHFHDRTSSLNELKKKVSNHFDEMVNIVKRDKNKRCNNLELKLLNDLYQKEKYSNYYDFNEAKIYYTDHDVPSFDERYIKNVKYKKIDDDYIISINMKNVKDIRIDPIEGAFIAIFINYVNINGENKNYIIPSSIEFENWYYIFHADPQIIILDNDLIQNKKIEISMKIQNISSNKCMNNILNCYNFEIEKRNVIQNELTKYNNEYPILFRKDNISFFKRQILKIVKKL